MFSDPEHVRCRVCETYHHLKMSQRVYQMETISPGTWYWYALLVDKGFATQQGHSKVCGSTNCDSLFLIISNNARTD